MRKPAGKALNGPEKPTPSENLLDADTLVRTLRAVATELERDPVLAQRVAEAIAAADCLPQEAAVAAAADTESSTAKRGVNRSFRPRLVTGTDLALGGGILDPYAIYQREGEAGLRAALSGLRLGSLRAIVREHGLDPAGSISRQNDADKMRKAILAAVRKK
jgi:hypothetical protein